MNENNLQKQIIMYSRHIQVKSYLKNASKIKENIIDSLLIDIKTLFH